MREMHRSALVAHPAERMFDVIERVEDYPQFLPWCVRTTLLQRDADVVAATVEVGYRDFLIRVTTRNPKRRPEWMAIQFEDGSFRHFQGEWTLRPLGSAGCRIDFLLRYELALPGADRLAGGLIDSAANRMVDAFVQRADHVAALALAAGATPPGTASATAGAPTAGAAPPATGQPPG